MVRTAREHEVIMARNIMPNDTDMQDTYCGHSNDIRPIQSQCTKVAAVGRHHKRGGAALRPRHLFCGLRSAADPISIDMCGALLRRPIGDNTLRGTRPQVVDSSGEYMFSFVKEASSNL